MQLCRCVCLSCSDTVSLWQGSRWMREDQLSIRWWRYEPGSPIIAYAMAATIRSSSLYSSRYHYHLGGKSDWQKTMLCDNTQWLSVCGALPHSSLGLCAQATMGERMKQAITLLLLCVALSCLLSPVSCLNKCCCLYLVYAAAMTNSANLLHCVCCWPALASSRREIMMREPDQQGDGYCITRWTYSFSKVV